LDVINLNAVDSRANSSWSITNGTFNLTTQDGTVTATGFERVNFSDGSLALDINGDAGQAYRLYQAALDRTPDAVGLGYWISALDGGTSLNTAAADFIASSEFQQLYGTTFPIALSLQRSIKTCCIVRRTVQGMRFGLITSATDIRGLRPWPPFPKVLKIKQM